jgi:hypothetical protein
MKSIQMAVQIDSAHWLVIFIHENGVISAVMDSHDFIDLIINEAESGGPARPHDECV